MYIKIIKDYLDKETGFKYFASDESVIRQVSDNRGKILIKLGIASEIDLNNIKENSEQLNEFENAIASDEECVSENISDKKNKTAKKVRPSV